jgi:hypothetical protein
LLPLVAAAVHGKNMFFLISLTKQHFFELFLLPQHGELSQNKKYTFVALSLFHQGARLEPSSQLVLIFHKKKTNSPYKKVAMYGKTKNKSRVTGEPFFFNDHAGISCNVEWSTKV